MLTFSFPYAHGVQSASFDEKNLAEVLEPNQVPLERRSVEQCIREALDTPIGSPRLNEIIRPGETVCIVISDVTRSWQAPKSYLPILVEELGKIGVRDDQILIISATGTHRAQTEAEWKSLIGESLYARIRIIDHDCRQKEQMRYVGTTSRGTPVWLNRAALDCDRLILTGGVVYHFLAGYGGGRKSIVPGIAYIDTILHNHNFALNPGIGSGANPDVHSGNLEASNPFHSDMEEAAAFAKPDFLLNVVADSNQNITAAFAGHWIAAHRAACALVHKMDGVHVKRRADLVIASAGGYPKDINLYQSSKTITNQVRIANDGAVLIMISACLEGFGDKDCAHYIQDFTDMTQREADVRKNFSIGGYVGYLFAEFSEKYHLICVTEMEPELFKNVQIDVVKTLDEALELAKTYLGGTLDVPTAILEHGAQTLPILEQ